MLNIWYNKFMLFNGLSSGLCTKSCIDSHNLDIISPVPIISENIHDNIPPF